MPNSIEATMRRLNKPEPVVLFAIVLGTACLALASACPDLLAQEKDRQRPSQGLRSITELLWVFEEEGAESDYAAKVREELARGKVKTPDETRGAATQYKMKHGGILAEEGADVVGLVRIAFEVPGFTSKGDLVWIVRFGTAEGVTQELWISATTGNVRAVLPPWPKSS